MKKNLHSFIIIIITALILTSCSSVKNGNTSLGLNNPGDNKKETSIESDNSIPDSPYDYERVIKNQKNLLEDFSWPVKHEIDLNDDGIAEKFLAVEGYSRGMNYALFSKKNNSWLLISGDETIASGHLGIEKSEKTKGGWHDFTAYQPSGRDGIIESYYFWNGKQYILKKQKEVKNKE